jgi:CHASE2 domain-containing sensor protein
MYRDAPYPPGTDRLWDVLRQHPNIYWVFKIKGDESHPGIPPPAPLAGTDRAVFADNVEDPDQVLRRALLFADDGTTTYTGLAMALATAYLAREHVTPQPAANEDMRLGRSVITPLDRSRGPYVKIDDRGFQMLIDYRGGREPFRHVSFSDVMDNDMAAAVRDRIVLIGYHAESVKDYFVTPFSTGFDAAPLAGHAVHGHIVEQLIRMALTGSSPLWGLPHIWENLLLALIACISALAGNAMRSRLRAAAVVLGGIVVIAAIVYGSFGIGVWLPGLPAALIWFLVSGGLAVWEFAVADRLRRQERQLRHVQLLASGRQLLLLAATEPAEDGLDNAAWDDHRAQVRRELLTALQAVDPSKADWVED